MPDNLEDVGPLDGLLISMTQDHEVAYRTEKYGVTREALQAVVDRVGHSVKAVEAELGYAPED